MVYDMSRSGYSDDSDEQWHFALWRGTVASTIRSKRGQAFLREMLASLDSLPIKRLVANELEVTDLIPCSHWGLFEAQSVCAIGAVGRQRGVDMSHLDPDDYDTIAGKFGISSPMAQEIVWINDEAGSLRETPEDRFLRVRGWVAGKIQPPFGRRQ